MIFEKDDLCALVFMTRSLPVLTYRSALPPLFPSCMIMRSCEQLDILRCLRMSVSGIWHMRLYPPSSTIAKRYSRSQVPFRPRGESRLNLAHLRRHSVIGSSRTPPSFSYAPLCPVRLLCARAFGRRQRSQIERLWSRKYTYESFRNLERVACHRSGCDRMLISAGVEPGG